MAKKVFGLASFLFCKRASDLLSPEFGPEVGFHSHVEKRRQSHSTSKFATTNKRERWVGEKRKRFNRTGETLEDGAAARSVFNFMVKFESYKEDLLADMKYGTHGGALPVFHFMVKF